MPDAIKVFTGWMKRWQPLVAVALFLCGAGFVWGTDKADREAIHTRLLSVEKRMEKHDVDRDLLIRIDATVGNISDRLKRLEER